MHEFVSVEWHAYDRNKNKIVYYYWESFGRLRKSKGPLKILLSKLQGITSLEVMLAM